MRRQTLELQADRIEMVLASHRVPSRVWGGTLTPRSVLFFISPRFGTKLSKIKALSEEIALSLGVPSCRISRQKSTISIEIPRQDPCDVRLIPLCQRLAHIPPYCAVLGIDEEGTPILVRLSSPDVAHILIAGTTGSGKTALARAMIASLAMYNRLGQVQMVLIDPKGRGFRPFAQLPHLLCPILTEIGAAQQQLFGLLREMERRDGQEIDTPRLIVFIDELADLMLTGGKRMERVLTRLSQRGRSAGIHLVACTQKPTAAVIGSLIKSNFPVRIVGRVTSAEDAKVATGLPGTGAERLQGRGDFLLIAQGEVTRIQAAYVTEGEIRGIARQIRSGERRSRRWASEAIGTTGGNANPVRPKAMATPLRRVK